MPYKVELGITLDEWEDYLRKRSFIRPLQYLLFIDDGRTWRYWPKWIITDHPLIVHKKL